MKDDFNENLILMAKMVRDKAREEGDTLTANATLSDIGKEIITVMRKHGQGPFHQLN